MKKCVGTLLLWCVTIVVYAQFDAQTAHYMFFQSSYNPAAAGNSEMLTVAGLHRMQYAGLPKMPQTTMFHLESPFPIKKTKHGAAVHFTNETIGLLSNKMVDFQYAYRHKIGKGYLSAGVGFGFVSVGFQGDSVITDIESDYHDITGDTSIPNAEEEAMNFDMSVGLAYTAENWFVGASFRHLNYPRINWTDYSYLTVRGIMTVMGGYECKIKDTKLEFQPIALLQTDFATWSLAVTAMMEYNQKYRGGIMWRLQDAVGILLGMDVIAGLSVGYTYELPTTRLLNHGVWGSHEIFLAYSFDVLRQKNTSKYKSIRIL